MSIITHDARHTSTADEVCAGKITIAETTTGSRMGRALAPDFSLHGRRTPGPELPRRHDAYLVDLRLPSGELPGEEQHRGDLQRLGGLELEGAERNPAGCAVGRCSDEIDGDGQRHRKKIGRPGQKIVNAAVDLLHGDHDQQAADQQQQLLTQEMRRRTGRMGVVGHLGRRGVDHQHRDHRQRGDDDPQHAVARKEAEPRFPGRSRPGQAHPSPEAASPLPEVRLPRARRRAPPPPSPGRRICSRPAPSAMPFSSTQFLNSSPRFS